MEKKTDRRTLYTKGVIKEALLKLMEEKPFDKITVTEICRRAEINRGTYYLHYYEQTEIIDDLLDDAFCSMDGLSKSLQITRSCAACECSSSLCALIRHSQRYRVIFMDESLTGRVIERIAAASRDDFVRDVMAGCGLSEKQAEAIFFFQINGCLAISKAGRELGCDEWVSIRQAVDSFILGGLENLSRGK